MNRSEMYSKEDLAMLNPSTPQPRQRDESTKLQEQVRALTIQLQRERRSLQKAEVDMKELEKKYKTEVVQIQTDVEVMKTNLQKAKLTNKTLLVEKDKAVSDLKSKSAAYDELKSHVKSLVTVFVDSLEQIVKQDDTEAELERVRKMLSYKLNTLKNITGTDFDLETKKLNSLSYKTLAKPPSIQSIYQTEADSFYPTDKSPITYEVEFFTEDSQTEEEINKFAPLKVLNQDLNKKSMMFQEPPDDGFTLHKSASREKTQEVCWALADFDFVAEQDGDLDIRKGDMIQVLTKDESGWWQGRIKSRMGSFPSNYVHLIS